MATARERPERAAVVGEHQRKRERSRSKNDENKRQGEYSSHGVA
jgi:hypothetical protein